MKAKTTIAVFFLTLAGNASAKNNIYQLVSDTITVQRAIVWPNGTVQTSSPTAGGGGFAATPSTMSVLSNEFITAAQTYQATGLSVSFALTTASHKVKISAFGDLFVGASSNVGYVTIKRDAVDLDATTNGFGQGFGDNPDSDWFLSFTILDSPGDTSTHVYQVYIRSNLPSSNSVSFCNNNTSCTMTVEEVP